MELTRTVLIEKRSQFWRYNYLVDVPESEWIKTYHELLRISKSDMLEYVIGKIILPLLKTNTHELSEVKYDNNQLPYHDIKYNKGLIFQLYSYSLTCTVQDFTYFYPHHTHLKETIYMHFEYNGLPCS